MTHPTRLAAFVAALLLLLSFTLGAEDWSKQFEQTTTRHLVNIEIMVKGVQEPGNCSGTVVGEGEVLTAAHCFLPVEEERRGFIDGKEVWISKADGETDLVLLRVDTKGKSAIKIPLVGPKVGKMVAAVGLAAGDDAPSMSPQSVMHYRAGYIYTNNMFFHGYSGGPLIDSEGRLAGIMTQTNPDWNFSMSVDIQTIRKFLYATPDVVVGMTLGTPALLVPAPSEQ